MIPPPPPALADLPYGYELVAGLGTSTVLADLDFETYSEAGYKWTGPGWGPLDHAAQGKTGIAVVGAARYAEHPTTEVLCMAYNLRDGRGDRLWKRRDAPPEDLFAHIARGRLVQAWNVSFEWLIWEHVCVKRLGWPPFPPAQWRCAMAKARAFSLPGKLELAAVAVGAEVKKNPRGPYVIKRFCCPRNPTKNDTRLRIDPETDADGPLLYDYCIDDIRAQAAVAALCPDLT